MWQRWSFYVLLRKQSVSQVFLLGSEGVGIEEDGTCPSHKYALRRIHTTVLLYRHAVNLILQSLVCPFMSRSTVDQNG